MIDIQLNDLYVTSMAGPLPSVLRFEVVDDEAESELQEAVESVIARAVIDADEVRHLRDFLSGWLRERGRE